MSNPAKQLCSINIMFPIQSDDEAIEVKKKIQDILSTIADCKFDFRIVSMPVNPNVSRMV